VVLSRAERHCLLHCALDILLRSRRRLGAATCGLSHVPYKYGVGRFSAKRNNRAASARHVSTFWDDGTWSKNLLPVAKYLLSMTIRRARHPFDGVVRGWL